jgi:hypothetical protein
VQALASKPEAGVSQGKSAFGTRWQNLKVFSVYQADDRFARLRSQSGRSR